MYIKFNNSIPPLNFAVTEEFTENLNTRSVSVETNRFNGKTKMPSDSMRKLGLFFNELNRITVWEPEAAERSDSLKDECKHFTGKLTEFHATAKEFINMVQELAEHVEREKIKALGSSNLLRSMSKQRENQQQQCQSLIIEKSSELERLRVYHQSLLRIQSEQQELLEHIQL